jgi:hypothetical protein
VFCCSGKLYRLRKVLQVRCYTLPVETNCTQIGGGEGNIWRIENLNFWSCHNFSELFESYWDETYLPYIHVEVTDDASEVSIYQETCKRPLQSHSPVLEATGWDDWISDDSHLFLLPRAAMRADNLLQFLHVELWGHLTWAGEGSGGVRPMSAVLSLGQAYRRV